MEKIVFFNPCKLCLTKAVCRTTCSDLNNHIDVFNIIYTIILLVISGVFEYIFIYYSLKYFDNGYVWGIITVLLIISYVNTIAQVFEDEVNFKKNKLYMKILIFVLVPICLPAILIWEFCINRPFNIEDKIQTINYRYNKKIR